ncbi:MAG: hypothetical protein O2822_07645 [Chloroflexi bacterium]|nr:hypothetical protein [Chloroflexota bacterium]
MRLAITTVILAALVLAACGPSASTSGDPFGSAYPTVRDQATGITAILGTPDLGVGTFRVAIALSDRSGLVRFPSLVFESRRSGSAAPEPPVERTEAAFHAFPDGIRGLHSTAMTFDRAGDWTISASVPRPDGSTALISIPVTIAERASAPVIGSSAPKSKNRTARDVPSLDHLTTGTEPDAALYQHRVADSIAAGRPLVVIFTSPAFCTTPLCGPQVEEASDLVKQYGDRVGFVHIDLFENPHEIKGDLSRAKRSPLLKDWGLRTDQWTFVIGADGRVAARFEAFAPRAELERAITRALG